MTRTHLLIIAIAATIAAMALDNYRLAFVAVIALAYIPELKT